MPNENQALLDEADRDPYIQGYVHPQEELERQWIRNDEGKVVGFFTPRVDKGAVRTGAVYVTPSERGKGYSRRALMEYLKEGEPTREFIEHSNTPSRKLFTSLGYTQDEEEEPRWGGGHWFRRGEEPPPKEWYEEKTAGAIAGYSEEVPPELNQWLHGIEADAVKRGYPNLFIAASDPDHPLGGGSVFRTGDTPDSEMFHRLRKTLAEWEASKGMDPDHDWRMNKSAYIYGYLSKEAALDGIIIENPKGTSKHFGDDYPIQTMTYPVDYGYLPGYMGEDEAELDFFKGTGKEHGSFQVWRPDVKGELETKFYYGLTPEEREKVLTAFRPVIRGDQPAYGTRNALLKAMQNFAVQKEARDPDKLPYRPTAEAFLRDSKGNVVAYVKNKPGVENEKFLKMPGGGVDPGEDPEVGLRRELMEETGITPRNLKLQGDVKWDWPDTWAQTPKQKERYQKFRGEHSHIYTGEVDKQTDPTSQEGDAWKEVPSTNVGEALQFMEGSIDPKSPYYQGPGFDKYKRVQLAALMALSRKGAANAQ